MPSFCIFIENGSKQNLQCNVQGQIENKKQKQLVFVKEWKYGRTPTNMVQAQVKLKLECLSKHVADADIPNTNTSLSAKSSIGDNIENYANGASPKEKLFNLWNTPQSNNQEQCAMPHPNLTPSCFCWASTKLKHRPTPHKHTHTPQKITKDTHTHTNNNTSTYQ